MSSPYDVVYDTVDGVGDFLYVADCKLATSENMAYLHQRQGRFITVLPRTRAEDAAEERVLDALLPRVPAGYFFIASRATGAKGIATALLR